MKQILAIDVPRSVAEKIKKKFSEKDEFSIFSEETVGDSVKNMIIFDSPIDLVLLNLRCVGEITNLASYIADIFSFVRNVIEVNVPIIVTCFDPGNQLSKLIDIIAKTKKSESILVTGKIIPNDLVILLSKKFKTKNFARWL